MKLTRNEPELRERLHEAVDSMSLFEIIALLFLVQYIRVSDVVKSLPRPRKALPEPEIESPFGVWEMDGSHTYYDESVEFNQEDFARVEKIIQDGIDRGLYGSLRVSSPTLFSPMISTPRRTPTGFFVGDGPSGPESGITYSPEPQYAAWLTGPMGYCTPSRPGLTGSWGEAEEAARESGRERVRAMSRLLKD